jgi:cation:H+ antiporter
VLSRSDGWILLLGCFQVFIAFIMYLLTVSEMKTTGGYSATIPDLFDADADNHEDPHEHIVSSHVTVLSKGETAWKILLGMIAVVAGGYLTIDQGISVSHLMGIHERFLGVTFIAALTSLPELISAVTAVRFGKFDMAIGNITGSVIMNIVLILGISGIVRPATYDTTFNIDMYVLIASTLLLYFFTRKRGILGKVQGIIFLSIYGIWFTWNIIIH